MKIVNLTPHAVTLHGTAGQAVTLPPSGQVARLAVAREAMAPVVVDGIELAVSRPTLGAVTGLPDAQDGVLLLVSALVADAVRRADVVSRGELVRDGAGVIVGARGLSAYARAERGMNRERREMNENENGAGVKVRINTEPSEHHRDPLEQELDSLRLRVQELEGYFEDQVNRLLEAGDALYSAWVHPFAKPREDLGAKWRKARDYSPAGE